MLAGLLYFGAGIGLAAYKAFDRAGAKRQKEAELPMADVPWLAGAIAMGGVVAPVLLMLGLTFTTASTAALLLNIEGLATMAIAWVVFHENVDRRLLVGAAAILGGAVLLSWEGQGIAFNAGAGIVGAACVAWGIDNNLTRKISSADPVAIAMLKGLVAGTINVVLALLSGAQLPNATLIAAAAGVGFVCVGISLVCSSERFAGSGLREPAPTIRWPPSSAPRFRLPFWANPFRSSYWLPAR